MYDNNCGYSQSSTQNQCSNQEQQISKQICKVHGKDKVIDFRDGLHYAKYTDFANIHGVGGKKHAPNSTIQVVLCDYTNGTGENSVNVMYRLEVEDIEILNEAAKKAYFGELSGALQPGCVEAVNQLRNWFCIPAYPDGTRPIPESEIVQTGQMLQRSMAEQSFSYSAEKSNPYAEENGLVPVQRISITYNALTQDGEECRYPWMISVDNFKAPIVKKENGASYHLSKKATEQRSANIMMTKVDFLRSMIAVSRYIHNWEALYRNTMQQALVDYQEQVKLWKEGQARAQNAQWQSDISIPSSQYAGPADAIPYQQQNVPAQNYYGNYGGY